MKFTIFLLAITICSSAFANNVLKNANFKEINDKGIPEGWFTTGKTVVTAVDNSVTLSLPKERGKQTQATIMHHMAGYLKDGKSYILTCNVRAGKKTSAQIYVEGSYLLGEKRKGLLTKNFRPFPVDEKGVKHTVEFTIPAKMERLYISMRTTDPDIPVTFSDLKLVETGADSSGPSSGEAVNIMPNADFKKVTSKGGFANWDLVGVTAAEASGNGVILSIPAGKTQKQATAMQHWHNFIKPKTKYRVSCRVKAGKKTSAQFYVEGFCMIDGKRKGLLTDFRPFAVDANGTSREVEFFAPAKMNRIYLSMRTTNPAVPVEFSDLKLIEISEKSIAQRDNLLKNPQFKISNGSAANWDKVAQTVITPAENGVTLSLPDGSKQAKATIMQHLHDRLEAGKTYIFTCDVKSEKSTRFQLYFEGFYMLDGKRKGFGTRFSSYPVDAQGITHKITFTIPAKMNRIYLSVRTGDTAIPITFSNMKLSEYQVDRVIGGYWDAQTYPDTPKNGVLLQGGRSAVLRSVPLKAGKTYKLTYKVEGNGDTGRKNFSFHQFKVSTRPIVAGGIAHADVFDKAAVPKVQILTVPPDASFAAVDITFSSETAGILKFSDFALTEFVRDPAENWEVFFTSPCYRNTIYPRTDTGRIAGKIDATAPAARAKLSIKGIAELDIALENGKGKFDIAADKVAIGKYPVSCTIFDAQGKELKKFNTDLRKVPSAKNEVIFDHRNNLLINGKPFFSISEYRSRMLPLKGGLYHMARNGINTYFLVSLPRDPEKLLHILDQLHAFGMKAVIEVWAASAVTPESTDRYIKHFNSFISPEVRQHPALLAYFTNDEPFICGRNPEPIVWTYNYIKDLDPYHPVWVNQSPSNAEVINFRPFVPGSDITGIDIYPHPVPHPHCDLPDKSLNCVGAYTRRMVETVSNRQSIWMILQAFNWHDHNFKNSTARTIYPNEHEMRFMYFDAIFNGSKGVSFYGTTHIRTIPFRDLIYRLGKEIRDLSGLFTAADAMPDLKHDTKLLRVARLKCGKHVYYGIFNQSPEEKTVSFPMEDTLHIYREGRNLVPKDGKITVKLAGHEVLICGTAPLPPPANPIIPCNAELEDTPDPIYDFIRLNSGIGKDIFASNFYNGKANWIWNKTQLSIASSSCVLIKKFTVDKIPAKAELFFCADDESDAYINGQFVGKGDEHGRLWRYDVTRFLKKGENMLLVNARDGGGLPCAFIADLKFDGKTFLVSDDSWQARAAEAGENFRSTEQNKPTVPAFITAPYGKGAWGKILLPDAF